MIELIVAVSFAIIISAGCSMCEAVLYATPLRHIERMVREKKQSGKIFKELRRDIQRPITAILSLNTIANTAGAAVAGAAAISVFGHQRLGYFSVFFTLAILIFSEVIPKTAGVVYTRSLVPIVALPLRWLVIIMTPVIWLVGHITGLIARNKPQESVSPDELKIMAQLSLRTGGIKQYQEIVIGNILSLETRIVKDVMTPRTVTFSLSQHLTLKEACQESVRWEHSRVPVYDKNTEDIVGIILTKDLFMAIAEDRNDITLPELMRPVHFVVETARLNNVLMEFIGSREKLFGVIDEYGGLSGVISLEDILEEILGREIVDESDRVADKQKLAREKKGDLNYQTDQDN
ncbi:hemolysin family protein [Deltaproteobacteria bacterium]|nr:hemolysin family protein [Deltaproteobacteria bacterium]